MLHSTIHMIAVVKHSVSLCQPFFSDVNSWGWSLLLLTVSHTQIRWLQLGFGELALQGMLSWPFLFTWPAAFVSNLLLAKWAGLKQICADHRSLPDVPGANFLLGFYHLCSSPPSGFITQHFCFFMSEYIWCGLNLFQLTQTPANTTVKPLYGSGMPWNPHTLDFLPSVSHHSLLCPFHLSTSPAKSCFSTPILTLESISGCNPTARLICPLQRCFLLLQLCYPPIKQLSFSNLTGMNACNTG